MRLIIKKYKNVEFDGNIGESKLKYADPRLGPSTLRRRRTSGPGGGGAYGSGTAAAAAAVRDRPPDLPMRNRR